MLITFVNKFRINLLFLYICTMMLEKYISALLYRYQCVTVPQFGAFITETESSKFNEVTRTFSPPKKTILFNSLLKVNDGLLAHHIAFQENISFEKAVAFIEETVRGWDLQLQRGEALTLVNIGVLQLNEAHKLSFEPIGSTNYLTSSFGLSTVISPIVMRENAPHSVAIEAEVSQHIPQKKRINYLRYAAVLVVGLGLFAGANSYQEYQKLQDQTLAIEKSVQTKVQQQLQQATFVIEKPEILTNKAVLAETKKYHIIAGAFRTEKRAQILVDELQKKGYVHAKYLTKSKHNMRQVVYNSYENPEEAQRDLRLIHDKVNKDAWIYVED